MATVNQCFVCNWLFEFRLRTIVRPLNLSIPIRFFPLFSSLYVVLQHGFFRLFYRLMLDQLFQNTSNGYIINFQNRNFSSFSRRVTLNSTLSFDQFSIK